LLAEVGRRAGRTGPWESLPRPFRTVIPNSVDMVRATEPGVEHRSLNAKYTPAFARLYAELAGEIRRRARRARRAGRAGPGSGRAEGA